MKIIEETKHWISSFVVKLNLCPFASYPLQNDQIRYVVYDGEDLAALVDLLDQELTLLQSSDPTAIETTLIIHPKVLNDFYDYIDFLDLANQRIFVLELEGELQIASFHPDYQFGGTDKDDVTNYTNRSPYPMLHLLREESIELALEHYEAPHEIPENNIAMMNKLGRAEILKMLGIKTNTSDTNK